MLLLGSLIPDPFSITFSFGGLKNLFFFLGFWKLMLMCLCMGFFFVLGLNTQWTLSSLTRLSFGFDKSWIICRITFSVTFSLFYISEMFINCLLDLLEWQCNFLITFFLYCIFCCCSTFWKICPTLLSNSSIQIFISLSEFYYLLMGAEPTVLVSWNRDYISYNFLKLLLCSLCCHGVLWVLYFICFIYNLSW